MIPVPVDHNIVLIGMPGVGKSTVGVLLAKAVSRGFVDTDVYIQAGERLLLQDILDAEGIAAFRAIEERRILALKCSGHVIATGGSVVYSDAAMRHLKRGGVVVYLKLPLALQMAHGTNLDSRGVVIEPGQSFAALFSERQPLYARYADITLDCVGLNHEQTVSRIMEKLDSAGERTR